MTPEAFRIREATAGDVPLVFRFIQDLAEYEKVSERVTGTAAKLHEALFGASPRAEAILGFLGEKAAAFAVFYYSFSTYRGGHCLHLEDLFVHPEFRGRGIGRRMLSHLAGVSARRGCAYMEWSSLAWNEPAKAFYHRLGASSEERVMFQLSGEALARLADEERE